MCDSDFMDKNRIKEECWDCLYKSLCLQVIDLIDNKKYDLALTLLENHEGRLNQNYTRGQKINIIYFQEVGMVWILNRI